MTSTPLHTLILADFNAANLAALLSNDQAQPVLSARVAPYGELGWTHALAEGTEADVVVVWTRPEAVSAAFSRLVDHADGALPEILADVDRFVERLAQLSQRFSRVLVFTWAPPRTSATFESLTMKEGVGLRNVVARMNLRLAEGLDAMPGAILLDVSTAIGDVRTVEEAKLWYAAKIPFRPEVFRHAAHRVKAALHAAYGGSRKLIVLDLDDTLWGGLVGEVGWAALRLGGHDAVGEAFADFQRTLLALRARGILLAVASKNEESIALEAIGRHPEMAIRQAHLAGWRINWEDKAANISSLADELNLGLSSVVFIDDNPGERMRVREALPEVLVPEWPASPLLYVDALLSLGCFDSVALTAEDRGRAELYAVNRARTEQRQHVSLDEWRERLDLEVAIEELSDDNLPRVTQLLNKTNQMNLTTRRVDAGELRQWVAHGQRKLWTFRVRDRFGDSGLTGVASASLDGASAALVDFVLSCRVFGRHIEHAMLHTVTSWARESGARELHARLIPTPKNGPCRRFLESSGLEPRPGDLFAWDLASPYPAPGDVRIQKEMAPAS